MRNNLTRIDNDIEFLHVHTHATLLPHANYSVAALRGAPAHQFNAPGLARSELRLFNVLRIRLKSDRRMPVTKGLPTHPQNNTNA